MVKVFKNYSEEDIKIIEGCAYNIVCDGDFIMYNGGLAYNGIEALYFLKKLTKKFKKIIKNGTPEEQLEAYQALSTLKAIPIRFQ